MSTTGLGWGKGEGGVAEQTIDRPRFVRLEECSRLEFMTEYKKDLECLYTEKMLRRTGRARGHKMSLYTDLNTRKSEIRECCDSSGMQVSAHHF